MLYEYSLLTVLSLRVDYSPQDLTAASVIKEDLLFAQGREFAPDSVNIHPDDQVATNEKLLFLDQAPKDKLASRSIEQVDQ